MGPCRLSSTGERIVGDGWSNDQALVYSNGWRVHGAGRNRLTAAGCLRHGREPEQWYYSSTFSAQNVVMNQGMLDGLGAIVQGRAPLSDLDGLIKTWRQAGGDKARTEFEHAIAEGS